MKTAGQVLAYGTARIQMLLVLACFLTQASGVANAQLGKALRAAAAEEVAEQVGFDFGEANFHQRIYAAGNPVNVAPREHLDALLMLAIEEIDRACSLSDTQRQRLVMAGHGDRKRFLDRVDEARRLFDRLRYDRAGASDIIQATQPLAADYEFGLYGEGSFFLKSLATTLTPEQLSRYREAQEEKLRFRYRAKVTLILSSIDARVGFTSEQCRRYAALIMDQTTPPAKPGSRIETSVVLLKIARLPEDKVRPLFDDAQWKTLGRILEKARSSEEMLRAQGQLD